MICAWYASKCEKMATGKTKRLDEYQTTVIELRQNADTDSKSNNPAPASATLIQLTGRFLFADRVSHPWRDDSEKQILAVIFLYSCGRKWSQSCWFCSWCSCSLGHRVVQRKRTVQFCLVIQKVHRGRRKFPISRPWQFYPSCIPLHTLGHAASAIQLARAANNQGVVHRLLTSVALYRPHIAPQSGENVLNCQPSSIHPNHLPPTSTLINSTSS